MKLKHPLTPKQVQSLAIMAGKAYRLCGDAMGYSSADEFRRDIVAAEVGTSGLSTAKMWHFVPLYNKFATLLGQPLKMADGRKGTAVEYWLRLIRESLQRYELAESYAVKLAMDKLGIKLPHPLDSLALQLGGTGCKHLLFTINNRGRAKLKAQPLIGYIEEGHGSPETYEPHLAESMPPAGLAEHFNCKVIDQP